jgi:hypothetical protein
VLHAKGEAGDEGPGDRPASTPLASASARNINSSNGPATAATSTRLARPTGHDEILRRSHGQRAGLMLGASRNMTSP